MNVRPTERGVALLNALIILAVVSGVAAGVLRGGAEAQARLALMARSDQARELARLGELAGLEVLDADRENSTIDHLGEPWADPDWRFETGGGTVTLHVRDAQGRFDLGALKTPDAATVEHWTRLVEVLGGTDQDAALIAAAKPRAPSALFALTSLDPALAAALQDHVVVLPHPAPLNVNTATLENLMALAPGLGRADAHGLIENRPYDSVEAFRLAVARRLSPLAMEAFNRAALAVSSRYFVMESSATLDAGHAVTVSLIERRGGGKPPVRHWRLAAAP